MLIVAQRDLRLKNLHRSQFSAGAPAVIDLHLKSGIENQNSKILQLLEEGRTEDALTEAEAGLQVRPDDGRLVMLHGIALGQVGRVDEAIGELRRAAMLSPTDPEAFYNLAVQLYDEGDHVEAAIAARQALRVDPNHERAQELLQKCDLPPGSEPFEAGEVEIAPSPQSIRLGPDDPVPHVLGLGEQWTWIGIGLLAVCVIEDVLLIAHNPISNGHVLGRDPLSVVAIALWIFTAVFSLFWIFIDLIDRRKKFVWLLPVSACGLCALPGLPIALYLWVGRRN